MVGVLLGDVFAAVQAGRHIVAGVDDGPVPVLGLARGYLAVAVALDSGVILAGLRLGRFVCSGLIIASSEHASRRPAAGPPFRATGGWLIRGRVWY